MNASADASPHSLPGIQTVLGYVPLTEFGLTDAHNHLWIEPVPGAAPDAPTLTEFDAIASELSAYRLAGGGAILDCQPGGCGRNGVVLAELASLSQVLIVACTGFHRRRYYPADYWLWETGPEEAASYFLGEMYDSLTETAGREHAVRAGFIKIACEAALEDTPQAALEGAALAARESGAALEIHTEKGGDAERILAYFSDRGVHPSRLVICHIDKRPDFGLHCELARAGVLLEYDTFYRPKYDPERNLWPLIEKMVGAGLGSALALATDMAEAQLWRGIGGGPGLVGLPGSIRGRLEALRFPPETITQMLGGNITRRLAEVKQTPVPGGPL